jgi:hypothetical protein
LLRTPSSLASHRSSRSQLALRIRLSRTCVIATGAAAAATTLSKIAAAAQTPSAPVRAVEIDGSTRWVSLFD